MTKRTIFHVDVNSAFLSWSALKHLAENPGRVRRVLLDVSPLKIGYDISRPVSELNAARVHPDR